MPLILSGNLNRDSLADQVALVTGAGTGIGFEAARSLAWLGARVVIAEINSSGKESAERINRELGKETAWFFQTDVGDEKSVAKMARAVNKEFGRVDIVINNATVAPLGCITDVPLKAWDKSYLVNLKGPVMLAKEFIPGMFARDYGVFVCVTSEGLAYMGAYETVKAAQGHLGRTLDAELEGTGISTFILGPGMVPTETALEGVRELARYHKKTEEEMFALVKDHLLSIEAAGAAYAAAVANAAHFRGQEIGSRQALLAAGIEVPEIEINQAADTLTAQQMEGALPLCQAVIRTLTEQSQGWQERSIFERQWMMRDFKKNAGMPVDQWLEALVRLEQLLEAKDSQGIRSLNLPLTKLRDYYRHMADLARGYTKDKVKLEENLKIIQTWVDEAEALANACQNRDGL